MADDNQNKNQNKNQNENNNSNSDNGTNTGNNNGCNNSSNNDNNNKNNNNNSGLTNHELLELHELFSNEIIGVKKAQMNVSVVQNEELKNFVQESLNTKKSTIQQMQNFVNQNVK